MLKIGDHGVLTTSLPYTLESIDYTVIGIHSIEAMLSMGLDVFALVYYATGIDKETFKTIPRDTPIYVLRSTKDTKYVPVSAVQDLTEDSRIQYSDKVIVLNMGSHPDYRNFLSLTSVLATDVLQQEGVHISAEVKTISKSTYVPLDTHKLLEDQRNAAKVAKTVVNTQVNRDQEILTLKARLEAVQRFLLHYAADCRGQDCCTNKQESYYPSTTVYYQYSLADFYLQAARGDVHDLPINNSFIDRLHGLNTLDASYHISTAIDPCIAKQLTAIVV